jgi:hAT family C-terminal dimerisation region
MHGNTDYLEVKGIDELSQNLIEKKKYIIYSLIYRSLTLALILPVTSASIERTFSAMNAIKEESRNRMRDQ